MFRFETVIPLHTIAFVIPLNTIAQSFWLLRSEQARHLLDNYTRLRLCAPGACFASSRPEKPLLDAQPSPRSAHKAVWQVRCKAVASKP
jgi:hypothetical protein